MKLRLPHKFQAALIAALASVSFTTLSSGTALGAVTLTDIGTWTGYDENTATAVVGNTGAAENPIQYGTIYSGEQDWLTNWSYVVTVDAQSLSSSDPLTILLVNMKDTGSNIGYSEGVKITGTGTRSVTLTSWSNANVQTSALDLSKVSTLTFVVTHNTSNDFIMDVYGDGNFSTKLVTAKQTGQKFSGYSVNTVETGSTGGRSKFNNDKNYVDIPADSTVGSYDVYGAGYTLGAVVSTADLQTYYNNITVLQWNGAENGDWNSTATNWLKWGKGEAMAFNVAGAQALFGKGDNLGKTVNVPGDANMSVGGVKVVDNYTFNMTGNLNAGKITIAEGASLARTGTGSLTGTLSGAGTYVLKAGESTLGSVTLGTDWTGTVRLVNVDSFGGGNLAAFANGTLSTVELNGIKGYTSQWNNGHYDFDIRLTDYGNTAAWNFSDGSNGGTQALTLNGSISGHGTLQKTKDNNQGFVFTGNISEWDGMYKHDNTATSTLTFKGNATVVNATINKANASGKINVNVGDGTNAFTTTFKKAVSASKLAINNKASATFEETLTLTNDLTLDGSATLEKGGSVGVIDLSHGGNAHGTLTLAAGQNLTYGSSFWGANNNKLILGEGALVKQASNAPIEIVGLAGESYVSSSANKQFSLSESAYTLHNVQATVKTANNDVQLHFDNSKLVAEQNITLKDLQSVFNGMDIKGGTTTVGASDATGTVTLGEVTLSGGNLALADLVTGNVSSIDVTGTSAISGGTLSMGGTITTQADARLTLGGTVLFANGGIATSGSGTLDFADDVMFDIRQLTEGENHTYTLFTGSGADLLTRFGDTAGDHIAGAVTTGRKWFFNDNGQAYYELLSHDLVWNGGAGIWTTETGEEPWHENGQLVSTYFSNDDAVTFMYSAAPAVATLGSDVTVSTMTLDEDTPDVTVNNDGTHSFSVEELTIKSGRLTTNTAINVKSVNIAAGAEWALGHTLDPDTVTTFNNNGLLRVLSGVELRVHKGSTAETIGTVTADAGGTLYVDNGSGKGGDKYTYRGSADAPFMGTLVYDINQTTGHDASIALENFQGTLELRGRLDAHDSSFGGMTKLVLNGDRATNTTGMWINGSALTLDVPVDIVGPNQVDLYTSTALTINGDINAGGAAGILGKRDGAALNLNGNVNLLGLNVYQNTVHLNGGAQKAYNLGAVTLNGGSLAVDAAGVGSLSAADLIVISTNTLSSATAEPTEFNVTRFDVSNHNTNFTLQNVELNVSGAATAAVLNTAQNADEATVTVDTNATLNLNGSVVWKKQDGAKTDYVNLTINNGGEAHVNGGTGNILNDVTVNAGGKLNFKSGTSTEIAGTLALADTIDNSGNVAINSGSVAAGQAGALSGNGTYTIKGTVAAAGTLKLDDTTVTGAGTEAAPAALTGNVDINGGTIGGTMNIGSDGSTVSILEAFTVANGAKLSFNGHVVLDALEATAEEHYIHGEQDDDNGFLSGISVKVYTPGENVDVIFPGGITYKGANVYDYMGSGTFSTSSVNYTTFFVNAAGTTESLDHALTAAEGHGTMTTVQLANGTSLAVDRADATLPHLVLTEGASATLNVTQSATITTAETGNGLTLTGDGALTLGSAAADHSLNGAGTLVIDGPTVTINGTNNTSFTGNVDIKSGTLKLGDSTGDKFVLGAYNYSAGDTRTITVRSGATLDINGKADANYVLTLDGGRFTNNAGNGIGVGSSQVVGLKLTANSYVGDSEHNSEFWLRERSYKPAPTLELNEFNLTKQGTSTFGLHSTTVTGSGYLVVEEGTVQLDGGTFGANLRMAGGTVAGTLNLAGNITIDTTKDSTISAVIAGSGMSVTKTGDGTLALSGANTYTGATTVSAGTLQFNQGFTFGSTVSGAGNITYGGTANGTLNFSNKDISGWTGSFNNTGSATATLNIARDGHVKAAIGNEQGGTINITSERDVYFDNVVNINDITHNTSHTVYIGTDSALGLAGEMTVTGHASTGRLVVGNASGDSAAVFTLSGENARLSNGTDHTYNAQVQGYGTFLVTNSATQSLTAGDLSSFHGTFAANGEGSILTLNTTLANDVTLKATNGGVINLMKSYTMGDNTAVDGGTLAVSSGLVVNGTVDLSKGTLTQTGGTVTVNADKSLTLGNASITSAIANSGTVNFTKDITATGLAKEGEDVSYQVGADDNRATNGNYFYQGQRTESTLRVVTGGTVNPGGHKVTQDNVAYVLKADGTATGVTGEANYRVFYQGEAGTTVSVSQLAATAAKHDTELAAVYSIGAWQNPTVLDIDQNLETAMVGFGTVNIGSGFDYTGDLLIYGGMNTVNGQLDIAQQVGFFAAQDSVTVFTDAPVVDGGVRFTSDAELGGVQVQANKVSDSDDNYYGYDIGDSHYAVLASELSKEGGEDATVRNSLQVNRVHNSAENASGKLTLDSGVLAQFLNEVTATSGDIQFMNMAAANLTPADSQTQVSLNKLEIGAGITVSFYEAAAPTSMEEMVAETTVTVAGTLTAGKDATLNANLVMGSKSTLDVSGTGGAGLAMGSTVTLNPGVTLSDGDMDAITDLGFMDQYTLFTGVDAFSYDGNTPTSTPIAFDSETWVKASEVFSNSEFSGGKDYYVFYSGAQNGSNVGAVYVMQLPEPTTGTLSLLALAALAARRRRK